MLDETEITISLKEIKKRETVKETSKATFKVEEDMSKVFVALGVIDYEGKDIKGVFTTRNAAGRHLKGVGREANYDAYKVVEFKLNEGET